VLIVTGKTGIPILAWNVVAALPDVAWKPGSRLMLPPAVNVTAALPLTVYPLAAVMEFVACCSTVPDVIVVLGRLRLAGNGCAW
jgi:hypothetical protein